MPLAFATTRPLVTVSSMDVLHGYGNEYNLSNGSAAPGSGAWTSANRAIYCPVYLAEPGTLVKGWIANGSGVNGNVDWGLYDESGNKLVSAGSTAMAGASVLQVFDVTDLYLNPGRYYVAAVCSTVTTATFIRSTISVSLMRTMGCLQQATALPLPSTATFATIGNAFLPLIGFSYRVTI